MVELKEFYGQLTKRSNLTKIVEYALPSDSTNQNSQNAALGVFITIVQLYNEKKKESDKRKAAAAGGADDEEDETLHQQSDEEEDTLIDVMAETIPKIEALLSLRITHQLSTTYEEQIVPLGSLRLKGVELVHHLQRLNKTNILTALAQSTIYQKISGLVEAYPWNNFLQLRVISIYEDIFDINFDPEMRSQILEKSELIDMLVRLGAKA